MRFRREHLELAEFAGVHNAATGAQEQVSAHRKLKVRGPELHLVAGGTRGDLQSVTMAKRGSHGQKGDYVKPLQKVRW